MNQNKCFRQNFDYKITNEKMRENGLTKRKKGY